MHEPQQSPNLIAGSGRYGQIISRLLFANGYTATVLDHGAEQVDSARRFGFKVNFGDATRLDLLRTAGAASARVLALHFRRHGVEQLVAMAPHMGDEARLISISKAGRRQLDQLLAQERDQAARGAAAGRHRHPRATQPPAGAGAVRPRRPTPA